MSRSVYSAARHGPILVSPDWVLLHGPTVMKLLLIEPGQGGHRPVYVSRILAALESAPIDVTVSVPRETPDDPAWTEALAAARARGEVRADLPTMVGSWPRRTAQKLAGYRRTLREVRPDAVWMPSADGLLQLAAADPRARAVPRGVELVAGFHRGRFAYPGNAWSVAFGELSRRLIERGGAKSLLFVDPLAAEAMRRARRGGGGRIEVMPDPIPPVPHVGHEAARRELGLPTEGRWVGITGGIDRRKGGDQLVAAFALARLDDGDRLLLAGRMAPPIRELVASHPRSDRIVALDRFLSEDELHLALCAMDVVCLPYDRHIGISSILLRAAAARRPILGCDYGYIGSMIERFGLGMTSPVSDPAALAERMPVALTRFTRTPTPESPQIQKLIAFHSLDNFEAAWRRELPGELGRDASPGLRWDEV